MAMSAERGQEIVLQTTRMQQRRTMAVHKDLVKAIGLFKKIRGSYHKNLETANPELNKNLKILSAALINLRNSHEMVIGVRAGGIRLEKLLSKQIEKKAVTREEMHSIAICKNIEKAIDSRIRVLREMEKITSKAIGDVNSKKNYVSIVCSDYAKRIIKLRDAQIHTITRIVTHVKNLSKFVANAEKRARLAW